MKRLLIISILAAMALPRIAFGDTIATPTPLGTVDVTKVNSSSPNFKVLGNFAFSGATGNTVYSVHLANPTGGFTDFSGTLAFTAYCLDLNLTAGAGTFSIYNLEDVPVGDGMGPITADAIRVLFGLYADEAAKPTGSIVVDGSSKAITQTALQLAVWDILYDTDRNVTGGTGFKTTSGNNFALHTGIANAMLASLADTTTTTPRNDNLYALYNGVNQTWAVVSTIGGDFVPVPEPGALVGLLTMGLMGLVIGGRRFRRSSR